MIIIYIRIFIPNNKTALQNCFCRAEFFRVAYSTETIEYDNIFDFYKLSYKTRTLDTLYQILLAEEVHYYEGRDNHNTCGISDNGVVE